MNAPCYLLRSAKGVLGCIASLVVLAGVVPIAIAQPTPVLQYVFDSSDDLKGGGIHDHSGNGYDGTVLNPRDATLGVLDHKGGTNAIHLNKGGGTFGGVFTDTYTSLVGIQMGPFTAMAWVNRDNQSGDNMVFGVADGTPALHLGFRDAMTYMGFWGNDSSAAGIPTGEWHHVTWWYDPGVTGGNQTIYIDGVVNNSEGGHGPYGYDVVLLVGTNSGNNGRFGGFLDGIQIFNVALRDDQVLAIAMDMPIPP